MLGQDLANPLQGRAQGPGWSRLEPSLRLSADRPGPRPGSSTSLYGSFGAGGQARTDPGILWPPTVEGSRGLGRSRRPGPTPCADPGRCPARRGAIAAYYQGSRQRGRLQREPPTGPARRSLVRQQLGEVLLEGRDRPARVAELAAGAGWAIPGNRDGAGPATVAGAEGGTLHAPCSPTVISPVSDASLAVVSAEHTLRRSSAADKASRTERKCMSGTVRAGRPSRWPSHGPVQRHPGGASSRAPVVSQDHPSTWFRPTPADLCRRRWPPGPLAGAGGEINRHLRV